MQCFTVKLQSRWDPDNASLDIVVIHSFINFKNISDKEHQRLCKVWILSQIRVIDVEDDFQKKSNCLQQENISEEDNV